MNINHLFYLGKLKVLDMCWYKHSGGYNFYTTNGGYVILVSVCK